MLVVTVSLYALDLLPTLPPETLARWLRRAQVLVYALGLAIAIDLPIALGVGIVELALGTFKGQRVIY
jgi:hypothetical protein